MSGKDMDSDISVLIATKNRRKLLENAVSSVFKQILKPKELIIVNDGSTDDTKEYLDHLRTTPNIDISVINRPESGGVNAARNQGIKISKAQWVVFLDDDDELVVDAVKKIDNYSRQTPDDYSVFYLNTEIKKGENKFIGGYQFEKDKKFYDPTYEEVMSKKGLLGDCRPVFRKSLFSNPEYLFPETVNGFESHTIKIMAKNGVKMRYWNDVSTVVFLDSGIDHLSFTAPAKNPLAYLELHKKDLVQHKDYYRSHHDTLLIKYKEMAKLAFRGKKYLLSVGFLFKSLFLNNI